MAVPAQDGKRQVMLIWWGARRAFLLSPQSSALITYLWRKQPSFDNLVIFLYSYSNQPGRPNQQHRIDVTSWLHF
jgi:hypothetical protein